jgi:hypothetical protein
MNELYSVDRQMHLSHENAGISFLLTSEHLIRLLKGEVLPEIEHPG